MTARRILIAGTGTEVGKTTLGIALARHLSQRQSRVLALKPFETGFEDPSRSDAGRLSLAAGHRLLAPMQSWAEPVAPMRAALNSGHPVRLADVAGWVAALEAELKPQITLIETAGGLFTPLSTTETNLDLISALNPAQWVLVARNRLGVLHDAIGCVLAARARGYSPNAISFGPSDEGAPAANAADLAAWLGIEVYAAAQFELLATHLNL